MTNPLTREIRRIEPLLNESMKFHPISGDERELWITLHDSVCGFATNILANVVKERGGAKLQRVLGAFEDASGLFPEYERAHVVLRDPDGNTIDPSYTQFYRAVGLTPYNTKLHPSPTQLYPKHAIAVIKNGDECRFGEWFATDALQRVRPALQERAKQKSKVNHDSSDLLRDHDRTAKTAPEHARETLAGIWLPRYYQPMDDGDLDPYVSRAVDFILDHLENENSPHQP